MPAGYAHTARKRGSRREGERKLEIERAHSVNRRALCGLQIVNLKFIILHNLQLSDSNVHATLHASLTPISLSLSLSLFLCISPLLRVSRMQFHLLTASDCGCNSDSVCDSESDSAFTSFAFQCNLQSRFKVRFNFLTVVVGSPEGDHLACPAPALPLEHINH